MDAGVDQLVRNDQVAALRQGGKEREIGDIAIGQEQRRLGAEEIGGLGFQPFMFGRIAAQQARPARPQGHAARDRVCHRLRDHRIAGEAQIVVGREIAPGTRRKTAQPPALLQRRELRPEGFGSHGAGYRRGRKGGQARRRAGAI